MRGAHPKAIVVQRDRDDVQTVESSLVYALVPVAVRLHVVVVPPDLRGQRTGNNYCTVTTRAQRESLFGEILTPKHGYGCGESMCLCDFKALPPRRQPFVSGTENSANAILNEIRNRGMSKQIKIQ